MATFTVPAVFKAVDKVTAPVRKMQNSVRRFGRSASTSMKQASISMNRFNHKINTMFAKIRRGLGTLGLVAGFALITTAVGGAINTFADFEQANAGLAAVMNVTVEQNKVLANDAKRLGAITAKSATEVVGLQEAYARLGFAQSDILNLTESTIAGSVAMQAELDQTAELVGAMVKSFDNFESVDAPAIIDKLTKSTQTSALNFEKLETALPIVAGAANAAKVPFTNLLASLGKLSDAGIDASSSSTALRNIFLEAAKRGVPYQKLLDQVANSTDQLATANELFGKRGAVAAVILAKNTKAVGELDQALQSAGGSAQRAADKQLNTLRGSITILKSAWEGWILSLDDGNGSFSQFLQTSVKAVTEILSLATGTAKANNELSEAELRIRKIAERIIFAGKVIKNIVIGLVAFKVATLALNLAIGTYNIAIGIMGAFSKTASLAINGNTTALAAYSIASKVAAAATWLFSKALWANPITWVVIAIAALIIGIVLLIVKWQEIVTWIKTSDSWFAKLLRAALFPIILAFKAIRWAINGAINMFKNIVEWVKTSDSGFAKFIRGAIQGVINSFKILGVVLEKVGGFFSKIWNWIKKFTSGALKPIKDIINFFSKGAQKELGVPVGIQGDLANKAMLQENVLAQANRRSVSVSDVMGGYSQVQTRDNRQPQQIESRNRVDMYINDRSKNNHVYVEGTGIDVKQTGYAK